MHTAVIIAVAVMVFYIVMMAIAGGMYESRHGSGITELSEGPEAIAALFWFISIPVMIKNDKRRHLMTERPEGTFANPMTIKRRDPRWNPPPQK